MSNILEDDTFENETFDALALEGADLGDREFHGCTFRGAKLGGTRWMRSRLSECVFESCDLTRADFRELSLRDVKFRSCKLMGIDFSPIGDYPDMSFEECSLRYASFVKLVLRKTLFTGCSILEANLIELDLVDSTFDDCQFAGTRIEQCDLRRVRFRGATGLFIDPAKNRVKGAEVPIESAALLAMTFGMKVTGFAAGRGED